MNLPLSLAHGDLWLLHDGKDVVRTPGGQPLGSRDRALVTAAGLAWKLHRGDPADGWSSYALLCSYLDFAAEEERMGMVESIVTALEDDPTYREMAMRMAIGHSDPATALEDPYPIEFLRRIGFCAAWSSERVGRSTGVALAPLQGALRAHLADLPMRRLMSLIYACSHLSAPLTFAAVIDDSITPKQGAKVLEDFSFPAKHLRELKTFARALEDRQEVLAAL